MMTADELIELTRDGLITLGGHTVDHCRLSAEAPDVQRSQNLLVIEEHVTRGGVGQMLAHHLLSAGTAPRRFASRAALGYVSGRYGSQKFHRRECGLHSLRQRLEARR